MNTDWKGVFTALVTPMNARGEIDWPSYDRLIENQLRAEVSGIIPCGTTGESPTLSQKEKEQLILRALEMTQKTGTRVFAGTGSNDTQKTIEFSKWADGSGVAGILVVTPYYNKPSQAGLLKHFFAVADAVSCEVMPYNVPGRTGVSMTVETMAELAQHPRINSLKEATGNVALTSEIRRALELKNRKMAIFSGDDATYLPLLAVGAKGCVSVASNLIPRELVEMTQKVEKGALHEALKIHEKYFALLKDLFIDTNPVPIKFALQQAKLLSTDHVRLPLVPLGAQHREILSRHLRDLGILKG